MLIKNSLVFIDGEIRRGGDHIEGTNCYAANIPFVKAMLDHLTSPGSSTRMDLVKGDKVVVMVNNLGSVTNLEMGILTNEVINQLTKSLEVVIER